KALLLLLKTALLIAGFCAALWVFMPWREAGMAALSLGASGLEGKGMRLDFSDVEGEEGGFTVNGLSVGGFVNFSFASLTLRPQLLASLMSLAPVCEMEFRGGSMMMGQKMNLGDGGFLLTAAPSEVLLEGLHADGDFVLEGFLTIDPARMKIGRAEAEMKVPASFEGNMDTLKNFLPLVKEGNRWFLRRQGGAN
ncbi:MAG: hypothetical protein IJ702_08900, partial [Fretibacterium sp.]|nr:hypothetical protein [Fretibacterium sp.]